MALQKVDMTSEQQRLAKLIQRAKDLNSYDARAFDGQVTAALRPLIEAGDKIHKDYYKLVDDNIKVAKKAMDDLEKLAKKGKKASDSDLKVMETLVRTLERCSGLVEERDKEMFAAVSEFRGGWDAKWAPLFSDPKLVEPFKKVRGDGIEVGKQKTALRNRMLEYVERGKALVKAVQAQADRGASMSGQGQKEIDALKTAVTRFERDLKDTTEDLPIKLNKILKLDAKTKLNAAMSRAYNGMLSEVQSQSKVVRGVLKTFDIQLTTFKKNAAHFDKESQKKAQAAYDAAKKLLKKYADAEKKYAPLEPKAVKHMAGINKLK